MKKYSSYANLKITPTPKGYPNEYWPAKITTTTPMTRRGIQIPLMMISKQPYAVPTTTKYSAGYIQRQKLFSSKKQNKDVNNVNSTANFNTKIQHVPSSINITHYDTKVVINKPNSSKSKKNMEDKQKQKQRSVKKQNKQIKMPKCLDIQTKQNLYSKILRYDVQSPKGIPTKIRQQKQKSKTKVNQKEKEKVAKTTNGNYSKPKQRKQREKQKQQENLNQYVTKYQPEPKALLLHCTSDPNIMKAISLQEKKPLRGYYKSAIFNAFFSSKLSSFSQICKSHVTTSIQFLSYVRKNKHIIPTTVSKLNLPPTNRKTLIFDLDQTLIHCNESLDMPHDVALEITFPNNSKIKAGINIRPYAVQCLKQLSKYFQIIVFTASHECYANVIIDYLDPHHELISHRFFRETCHKTQAGFYVKDLRVFTQNRDLSNLLLIDNAAYSYCFQPENGVPIVPFYNNKADLQLKQITLYLKQFITTKDMRSKNQSYMKLTQYHRYTCPKQLINQLYF